jgi:hypothetical protein
MWEAVAAVAVSIVDSHIRYGRWCAADAPLRVKHNCVNCGAPIEPADRCSYCLTPYDKETHEREARQEAAQDGAA